MRLTLLEGSIHHLIRSFLSPLNESIYNLTRDLMLRRLLTFINERTADGGCDENYNILICVKREQL